jgi:hypothetical protein
MAYHAGKKTMTGYALGLANDMVWKIFYQSWAVKLSIYVVPIYTATSCRVLHIGKSKIQETEFPF